MNDKDQAAIDHVASVSKHTHAAMIVKWLITGWDAKVKIGDTWEHATNPAWTAGYEYRLIEPKPAKPAYRVYADQDGDLFVAERNSEGGICQTHTERIEWISDWIEYDQPKKWPTPLVERIAAIKPEAAEWIVDHWDDLLDDRYTNSGRYSREASRLNKMFDWEYAGCDFDWEYISDYLVE